MTISMFQYTSSSLHVQSLFYESVHLKINNGKFVEVTMRVSVESSIAQNVI